MQSISSAVSAKQKDVSIKYFKQVNMLRRYWNGSAFVYDAVPINITDDIKDVGNLAWNLDTEQLNIWRTAGINLTIDNSKGKYHINSFGYFPSPYTRKYTQFQIIIGYILDDGSKETVYCFTGVLDSDPVFQTKTFTINFPISGTDIILNKTNASIVSDSQTDTGTWGGSLSLFDIYTTNTGVVAISSVVVDGVTLDPLYDYSVSSLNDFYNPAKITLNYSSSPIVSYSVIYRIWKKNIAVIDALGQLLDAAGFDSSKRTISSISLDSVKGYRKYPSFLNMSRNVDSSTSGQLKIKSEDFVNDIDSIETSYSVAGGALILGTYPNQKIAIDPFLFYENNNAFTDVPENVGWSKYVTGNALALNEIVYIDNNGIKNNFHFKTSGTSNTTIEYIKTQATKIITFPLKITGNGQFNIKIASGTYECYMNIDYNKISIFDQYDTLIASTYINETNNWNNYHTFQLLTTSAGNVKASVDNIVFCNSTLAFTSPNQFVRFEIIKLGNSVIEGWIPGATSAQGFAVGDNIYWSSASTGTIYVTSKSIDFGRGMTSPFSLASKWGGWHSGYQRIGNVITKWTNSGTSANVQIDLQTYHTDPKPAGMYAFPFRTVSYSGDIGTPSVDHVNTDESPRYCIWKATITGEFYIGDSHTGVSLDYMLMPAHLVTVVEDCTQNASSYLPFISHHLDNNGAITVYSKTSPTGNENAISGSYPYWDWETEQLVSGGAISSTVQEFIRLSTIIEMNDSTFDYPILFSEIFKFQTSGIDENYKFLMSNYSSQTCQSAIEAIAQMFDCEIGVNALGKYFVRSKNISIIPVINFSDNDIIMLDNLTEGWNNILNYISVTYGNFQSIVNPTTEGDVSPNSIEQYGQINLDIALSNVLFDNRIDLTLVLAKKYYNTYKLPKRMFRIQTKIFPQVELGDIASITLKSEPWMWFWGDKNMKFGMEGKSYFSDSDITINSLAVKIIGIEISWKDLKTYLKVREV